MDAENRRLLKEGLAALGGSPGRRAAGAAETLGRIERFLDLVRQWNERINLTAITGEREMVVKHVLDSAALLGVVEVEPGMRVLDVGTGAGFPGMILKLLVPEAQVALLDSVQKKCRFLEEARRELGITGLDVIWSRAEDAGRDARWREQFDLVTARAVAELRVLAELCLPFCRVGGRFVALKGPGAADEVAAARRALEVLGGAVEQEVGIHLPGGMGERRLIVCRKVRPTPPAYPRKAGVPERRPL